MQARNAYLQKIDQVFTVHPICALLGPRQCGKTTLANIYAKQSGLPTHIFDLEDEQDLVKLSDPKLALSELSGLIVIDEIQRRPDLFPMLRVLVDKAHSDRLGLNQKFLILGSASRDLTQQSSETLAGRIEYLELTPFSLSETGDAKTLWVRGGFPKSYLGSVNK